MKKFLEQEKRSDLLKFWMQAENFKRNILSLNKDANSAQINISIVDLFHTWQSDAIIIYDK